VGPAWWVGGLQRVLAGSQAGRLTSLTQPPVEIKSRRENKHDFDLCFFLNREGVICEVISNILTILCDLPILRWRFNIGLSIFSSRARFFIQICWQVACLSKRSSARQTRMNPGSGGL
jgi:hypothetical protein